MNILKKSINIPLFVLASAAILAVVYQAGAMRTTSFVQPAEPIRAAVVDLEQVFDQLDERADEDTKLKARGEDLDEEDVRRREELIQMEENLEINEVGSERFTQAQDEYIRKSIEYRTWKEFESARIEREKGLIFEKLYRNVKAAVKEMAEGRFDIVFLNDSVKELTRGTDQQIGMQISARRILYADPELDITADLIDRMNNDFTSRHGGS